MLDAEKTVYYLRKAKKGDKEAAAILLENNSLLIKSIIRRFKNKGVEYDDLYQLGCVGFLKAIKNFDEKFGVVFSTYAVPMIIGEIRRHLRDNNAIRVSRSLRDIAYKAMQAKEMLILKNNKEPTIAEIAKELGLEKEEVTNALDAIQEPVSLYEPIYNDGADSLYLMDQLKDDSNSDENWTEDIAIKESLRKLNNRERMIIRKRFFDGKTQMEVADEIGISQAQVSRLEKEALLHMRKNI